ncbi:MAG TPA: hypothetical protein VD886_15225 [Herpetosiphonaceae bacterium]|nr:hypothetical protein [Herpetosiphonaceae bacterium]
MNAVLRIILLLLGLLAGLALAMLVLVLLAAKVLSTDDHGAIQQRVTEPRMQITAVVVRDDCGATCGCRVRVDLELAQKTLREVYRDWRACDLDVRWTRDGALIVTNPWTRDGALITINAANEATRVYFRTARRENR